MRTLLGKAFGLVIDHVSNIKRHGFPDRPRAWTLDRRQKRAPKEPDPESIDITICTGCGKPYEAIEHACPYCGHIEVPLEAGAGGRGAIEVVKGDLTRLDAATLARMRQAMELPDPETMAGRAAFAGHHAGVQAGQFNIASARVFAQRELTDAIAHWAGYQRDVLHRSDSEIHRRFYYAVGSDIYSVRTGNAAEMSTLKEQVLSWIK